MCGFFGKIGVFLSMLFYPLQTLAYTVSGVGDPFSDYPYMYYMWKYLEMEDSFHDVNPCYGISNCYIVYGEQFASGSFTTYVRVPYSPTNAPYLYDFWESVGSRVFTLQGTVFNVEQQTFPDVKYPCANFGYQIGTAAPKPMQEVSCGGGGAPTPPPISCSINTPSIVLQHLTLNVAEIAGNRKTTDFTVACTRSASIRLTVTGLNGNSQLSLSNKATLYSTIRLNDTLATTGIRLDSVSTGGARSISHQRWELTVPSPEGDIPVLRSWYCRYFNYSLTVYLWLLSGMSVNGPQERAHLSHDLF